jgi:hypothetical protein
VCTNLSFQDQLCINEMTRIIGLPFISARTAGLFGYLFNDFGPKFEVFDTNGEECAAQMIASINDEGTVTCLEDKRHGLETGDYVTFSEIEGMTELNNCPPIKVKVTGPYTFEIGDTSSYSKYVRGGLVQQVKMPKIFEFVSLNLKLCIYNLFFIYFHNLRKVCANNCGNLEFYRSTFLNLIIPSKCIWAFWPSICFLYGKATFPVRIILGISPYFLNLLMR